MPTVNEAIARFVRVSVSGPGRSWPTFKVLWKVPNAYQSISPSIDHGTPVVLQEGPEISRSYRSLAETLAEASSNSEGSPDLVYSHEGARKKLPGRLNLSPIRAGQ